jgi:hypothetical protein
MEFNIDIAEFVHFYDADYSARRHSAAVKLLAHEDFAVQLLIKCLNEFRGETIALPTPCTAEGGGARLDKWLQVMASRASIFI